MHRLCVRRDGLLRFARNDGDLFDGCFFAFNACATRLTGGAHPVLLLTGLMIARLKRILKNRPIVRRDLSHACFVLKYFGYRWNVDFQR